MSELLRVTADDTSIVADLDGGPVDVPVRVFNVSSIVDGYRIDAPTAPHWLRVESADVRLLPGTDEVVPVRFVVDADRVPAHNVTVRLRIQSIANRDVARSVHVDVAVPEIAADVALTLEPAMLRGERAISRLTVRNQAGNVPVHVQLRGSDAEGVVRFAFDPQTLSVGPGQLAQARVQVSAPRPRERPVQRQLTVTASDGRREFTTIGTLEQQPPAEREPFNVRPLLRVVLTLLGAFLVFVGTFMPWQGSDSGAGLTLLQTCLRLQEPLTLDCAQLPTVPAAVPSILLSAGLVTVLLAIAAAFGLIGTGALTRFAGAASVVFVLVVLFVLTIAGVPLAPGTGALTVIVGGITATIGGILARP
ncbi:MAG: hypothetical protein KY460_15595 [Actinobacteria bacterium]|nr:hypothetical protein [Actinomycetota bacterium]